MPLDPISLGVNAVEALASTISGLSKKAKARKAEAQNKRPQYQIPAEVLANKKQADLLALSGMPAEQYSQAIKGINRAEQSAKRTSVDKRGGIGTIGAIQQGTADATSKLSAQSAAMKVANIRNAMAKGSELASYRDKAWNWNEKQKFEENAAAIRALKTAGNAELATGLNKGLGAAAGAAYQLTGDRNSPSSVNIPKSGVDLQDPNLYYNNQPQIPKDATMEDGMLPNGIPSSLLRFLSQYNMGGQSGL